VEDMSFLVSCGMGPFVFCVYSGVCACLGLFFFLRGVDVWSLYGAFCTYFVPMAENVN
jgi:hypothetical protein